MYRARRVIQQLGVHLGDLKAAGPWDKSTWSRFLRRRLESEPEGMREALEAVLQDRGHDIQADLWKVESDPDEGPEPSQEGEIQMQGQFLREEARKHFQLFRSPFDPEAMVSEDGSNRLGELYLPTDHLFAKVRLVQALTTAGFVALYGEPGIGKSTLYQLARKEAEDRKRLVTITPANVERRKMTAMHISAEIIRQLSEESVPRTANVRDHVATEVLKQRYSQGQRVALVIDEAHELPDNTIKDLKRFHEMSDSYVRLLAIVLLGQTELSERFTSERNHRLREAIVRCQLLHLPPLRRAGEVRGYMETRFAWVGGRLDEVWEGPAVVELNRRLAEHDQQIPVLIGNIANAAMNLAYSRAFPRVTEDEVIDVCSAGITKLREWGLA